MHEGSNFQSLVCYFFSVKRPISIHLFTILCVEGFKFAIALMLFNVTIDPIIFLKNTQLIKNNGQAPKMPHLKMFIVPPLYLNTLFSNLIKKP